MATNTTVVTPIISGYTPNYISCNKVIPYIVKSRLKGKALDFIGSREFSTHFFLNKNLGLQCLNLELCHLKKIQ